MAELGCLASIPIFSRTIPLAWDEPAKGFFHSIPRWDFLYDLSTHLCLLLWDLSQIQQLFPFMILLSQRKCNCMVNVFFLNICQIILLSICNYYKCNISAEKSLLSSIKNPLHKNSDILPSLRLLICKQRDCKGVLKISGN